MNSNDNLINEALLILGSSPKTESIDQSNWQAGQNNDPDDLRKSIEWAVNVASKQSVQNAMEPAMRAFDVFERELGSLGRNSAFTQALDKFIANRSRFGEVVEEIRWKETEVISDSISNLLRPSPQNFDATIGVPCTVSYEGRASRGSFRIYISAEKTGKISRIRLELG